MRMSVPGIETIIGGKVFPAPAKAPSRTNSKAMKTCEKAMMRRYEPAILITPGSQVNIEGMLSEKK